MKVAKWIYLGVPVLLGVGMLLASQPQSKQLPSHRKIDFDYDSSWNGVRLSSAESTTVAAAIESIRTAPPESLSYTNAAGSTITVSCSTMADCLEAQLKRGDIERETQNTADGGEYGREINVAGRHVARAGTSAAGMTFLEELLVHEETHKGAHQDGQTSDENETEAYGAELAYKDSSGLDSASNGDYRDALSRLKTHRANATAAESLRARTPVHDATDKRCFIDHGYSLNPDFFKSHGLIGPDYVYDLSPFLKASDMMLLLNYFLFPPEHSLALICGGEPILGHARIVGFDIFDGMVQPPDPYVWMDLTVPPYDPMFFYSMAYSENTGLYYLVDSLNQQIVIMADWNDDLIPDTLTGTYASAMMFPQLMGMRSVEPTIHRHYGFGLIVNHEDVRYTDAVNPYDQRFFLPDANGDNIADACYPVFRYEFAQCKPHILGTPWANDVFVQLFASWDHPIEVWTTDPFGEVLIEQLGAVLMGTPNMECWLNRPLMVEEYIIAIDVETGRKLNLATRVIDSTPQELTVQYNPDGILILRWDEVPGANYYTVYESSDPEDFTDATTYYVLTNELYIPIPPDMKMLFYRVTAGKEEGPMR